MSRDDDDRREIARQLFSRREEPLPPTEVYETIQRAAPGSDARPAAARSGPVLVCAEDRVGGLCLAGAVAAQLSAWDRGPWQPGTWPEGDAPEQPDLAGDVLAVPCRDGPWLRHAALGSRAAIVWSDDGESGAAGGLRLAVTLAGEAGVSGPIVVTASRALPDRLADWLALPGGQAPGIRWGGVWRPGCGLPARLAETLDRWLQAGGAMSRHPREHEHGASRKRDV